MTTPDEPANEPGTEPPLKAAPDIPSSSERDSQETDRKMQGSDAEPPIATPEGRVSDAGTQMLTETSSDFSKQPERQAQEIDLKTEGSGPEAEPVVATAEGPANDAGKQLLDGPGSDHSLLPERQAETSDQQTQRSGRDAEPTEAMPEDPANDAGKQQPANTGPGSSGPERGSLKQDRETGSSGPAEPSRPRQTRYVLETPRGTPSVVHDDRWGEKAKDWRPSQADQRAREQEAKLDRFDQAMKSDDFEGQRAILAEMRERGASNQDVRKFQQDARRRGADQELRAEGKKKQDERLEAAKARTEADARKRAEYEASLSRSGIEVTDAKRRKYDALRETHAKVMEKQQGKGPAKGPQHEPEMGE